MPDHMSTSEERTAKRIYQRWQRIESTTGKWPAVVMELRANDALVGFTHLDGADPLDLLEAWQTTPAATHLALVTVGDCELADRRTVPVRSVVVVARDGEAAVAIEGRQYLAEAMSTELYAAMVSAFDRRDELEQELAAITGRTV